MSVVDAVLWKGGRKGADGGTGVKDIGRLAQVMERESAKLGVFITAQPPTRAMERDAAAVGVWENEYTGRKHPRL